MSASDSASPFPTVSADTRWARLTDPQRLTVVEASGLLNGAASPTLDRLARLAAAALQVPVTLVSLVNATGQHFPGLHGLGGWAAAQRGTPLSHSFCQHVVAADAPLIVEDAPQVPELHGNLAVPDLGVVAYAGVPLRSRTGETLGALCAIDGRPVQWTPEQLAMLEDFALLAAAEIESRAHAVRLAEIEALMARRCEEDPITGTLNRRAFVARARRALTANPAERTLALIIWDIEGFRELNVRFGSDLADEMLVDFAALLTTTLSGDALIGRIGDDEFAALLAVNEESGPEEVIARVAQATEVYNASGETGWDLRTSAGAADTRAEIGRGIDALLRRATADRQRARGGARG